VEHCVTAHVTDSFGNPVPGTTVNFSVSGANTAAGVGTTDVGGNAQFCYTGTHAGLDTITALVAGTLISATASKTYVPAAPATLTLSPKTSVNTVGARAWAEADAETISHLRDSLNGTVFVARLDVRSDCRVDVASELFFASDRILLFEPDSGDTLLTASEED